VAKTFAPKHANNKKRGKEGGGGREQRDVEPKLHGGDIETGREKGFVKGLARKFRKIESEKN